MQNKKVVIPLETFIKLCADVRNDMDLAAFHLEFETNRNPATMWDSTHVPVLCDYYSCLNALRSLLEDSILSDETIEETLKSILTEDQKNGIVVHAEELQMVKVLMQQADVIKKELNSSGISMEVH